MPQVGPARPLLTAPVVVCVVVLVLNELTVAQGEHFINEWAAEIKGGRSVAEQVANTHGYFLSDQPTGLEDHYILHRRDVPHRSKRSANHHTKKLDEDARVLFVEQQQAKVRVKRSTVDDEGKQRWSRDLARDILKDKRATPDDPAYGNEWYFNPNTDSNIQRRSGTVTDLRVRDVWRLGYTGKNVVCTILDDGVEGNHTDLIANYDPQASYDINDNDEDPFPRYDPTNENKHGTRCAGEIAMAANNENCGIGVAFDSKIGGVRLLDGTVSDRTEAFSLSFNRDYIDIYSASWGPNDDGKTTEKPGKLVSKALKEGVTKGRGGKGSIFAWASGNGGRLGDNCNSDGYTSSIYTLSISSATQFGNSPWYAERCSSSMATTYSSGAHNEKKVVSADIHNKCTGEHSGTSAAAPFAAGIVALALERNPDLTWRDVQHLTIHSARMEPLRLEKGWYRNNAGYCVNLAFGFGLMDALAMVEAADPAKWETVGEQHICRVELNDTDSFPKALKSGESISVDFTTTGCEGQANEINFLEHVEVILDLKYDRRGAIYAELESPSGTITSLMQERRYDSSTKGFVDWPLMSVHTWGEDPKGTWTFRVADRNKDGHYSGSLENVKLILYGTKDMPKYRQLDPKNCSLDLTADPTRIPVHVEHQPTSATLLETMHFLQDTPTLTPSSQVREQLKSYIKELEEKVQHSAREDFMLGFV